MKIECQLHSLWGLCKWLKYIKKRISVRLDRCQNSPTYFMDIIVKDFVFGDQIQDDYFTNEPSMPDRSQSNFCGSFSILPIHRRRAATSYPQHVLKDRIPLLLFFNASSSHRNA